MIAKLGTTSTNLWSTITKWEIALTNPWSTTTKFGIASTNLWSTYQSSDPRLSEKGSPGRVKSWAILGNFG
ncbi:hypothetical protein Lal_00028536 [Lupinus albus]|nr:hypothetical protein Lal_00028536 [Lupinus albus]